MTIRRETALLAAALMAASGCSQQDNSEASPSKPTASMAAEQGAGQDKTIGFLVSKFVHAFYSSPMSEDCPLGLAEKPEADAILAKLSSAERVRIRRKENQGDLYEVLHNRGPGGMNPCLHPSSVPDPGMRTIRGRIAYGLDLDGDRGNVSANSCNQQDFFSPQGEPGIDHQYYRVLGCTYGLRSQEGDGGALGNLAATYSRLYVESGHAILIELTGVDDLVNDDDVGVGIYMSKGGIDKGAGNAPLPYTSMTVDSDPYWQSRTRGRIENSVLITEPIEVHLKDFILRPPGLTVYKQARLKLTLDPENGTAKGLLGAYHDLESVYQNVMSEPGEQVNGFSCEAVYYAMKRYADGLPDPRTGECTAVSAAYHIEAIPAMVIHEPAESLPE